MGRSIFGISQRFRDCGLCRRGSRDSPAPAGADNVCPLLSTGCAALHQWLQPSAPPGPQETTAHRAVAPADTHTENTAWRSSYQDMRPLQGRSRRLGTLPVAALRLPPVTTAQAFSLHHCSQSSGTRRRSQSTLTGGDAARNPTVERQRHDPLASARGSDQSTIKNRQSVATRLNDVLGSRRWATMCRPLAGAPMLWRCVVPRLAPWASMLRPLPGARKVPVATALGPAGAPATAHRAVAQCTPVAPPGRTRSLLTAQRHTARTTAQWHTACYRPGPWVLSESARRMWTPGSLTLKVVPSPRVLSTSMTPFISVTIFLAAASPKPVPPWPLEE